MSNPPTVGGYSFYLNVVVVDNGVHREEDSSASTPVKLDAAEQKEPSPLQEEEEWVAPETELTLQEEGPPETPEQAPSAFASAFNTSNDSTVGAPALTTPEKNKLLSDGQNIVNSLTQGSLVNSFAKRAALFVTDDSAMKKIGSSIGNSITKSSTSIGNSITKSSKRATAFVASKTMVSRAQKAVSECIPLVTEEIGVELNLSKRFQQGNIFVLEVDMKGCNLLDLLEKVLGDESATHYKNVRSGLDALGMTKTKQEFDMEILPKVRTGMMSKLSEIVVQKMKLKKAYEDLEIQVVALEDAEEAKWLYNMLEFMEQMK